MKRWICWNHSLHKSSPLVSSGGYLSGDMWRMIWTEEVWNSSWENLTFLLAIKTRLYTKTWYCFTVVVLSEIPFLNSDSSIICWFCVCEGFLIAWVQKSVSQVEAWPHDTNSQPRNKFYFWRAFEEDGKIMFLFVFEFHIYRHIFIWKNPELLQVPTLILWHLAEILLHLDCNLNYSLSFPLSSPSPLFPFPLFFPYHWIKWPLIRNIW